MRLPFLRTKTSAEPGRARPASAKAERLRAAAPGDDPATVEAARTRARRRLVGALVLLAIGVVGFPVLFESQPRPLSVDTPIELPGRDVVAVAPAPKPASKPAPAPTLPADAGNEVAAMPASAAALATPAASTAAPAVIKPAAARPALAVVAAAQPAMVAEPAVAAPAPVVALPAPSAPPVGNRFVVQVGAYTDAATLREARAKVEKAGLKTYTQVIENDAGKRTRVRVGPFATRQEADAAAAKVKRAGLPANVITL